MKTNLIQIEARAGKVRLNDTVHKWSADELISDIEKLYGEKAVEENMVLGEIVCAADDALETLEIEINSPGGSVTEGVRIFHALRDMRDRGVYVVATINGIAASMGSVIAMAADERRMTQGSRMMIHEASIIVQGDARRLASQSAVLESISAEIAEIYSEVGNFSADEFRQLMLDETWFSAKEAKDVGLVDKVIRPANAKNTLATETLSAESRTTDHNVMFESRSQLKDKLTALEADHTELENDLNAAKAQLETAQAELAELREAKAEFESTVSVIRAERDEAVAKADEFEAALEDEKVKTTPDAISALVTAQLATAGHPVIDIKDDDDGKTAVQRIKQEYRDLPPGPERKTFRDKHLAILSGE